MNEPGAEELRPPPRRRSVEPAASAQDAPAAPPRDVLSLPPLPGSPFYGLIRPSRVRDMLRLHPKEGPVHFWTGTRPGSKTILRRARSETPSKGKGRTLRMNLGKLFGEASDDAAVEILRPETIAEAFRRERCFPHRSDPSWAIRKSVRKSMPASIDPAGTAAGGPLGMLERLASLVPPSKAKKKPQMTPKEKRLAKLRVEFDAIFSEDELERQFAILKITEISREALKEIRDLMWGRFPELRGIFFTYARMDATVNPLKNGPSEVETISSQEYYTFCKDCMLFDKKFFTPAIANLIFVAINHEEELGTGTDDKELAGPLKSGRKDYDSESVFTLSEFLASLIRISVLKYSSKYPTDPVFRLRHLITVDIIPHARQDQKEELRQLLLEDVVHEVIRGVRRTMHRVFTRYAAEDEADALAINKLNVKEFIKLFEDAKMTGPDLTLREIREAFALSQADGGDDTDAGNSKHGTAAGDDDNSQMTFNEFMEGLCRCADVKYGEPCEDPDDDEERCAQLATNISRFCAEILKNLDVYDGRSPAPTERGRGVLPRIGTRVMK